MERGLPSHKLVRSISAAVSVVGVSLVFGVIWGPWITYNHLPEPAIGQEVVSDGRDVLNDALLAELGSHELFPSFVWANNKQLVNTAEKLLVRQIELPRFATGTFTMPLTAESMASGPRMWQLFVQSLGIPQVLLEAYDLTGQMTFLQAAAEYLVAYDIFEASGWALDGYLWNDKFGKLVRNDHAVASRVSVLTEFWRHYRHSPNYQNDVAEAIFRMVSRASKLLSDPVRFTFATNHGVMQNIALCNIQLAFPTLPGVEDHCRLSFSRLDEQFAFFINDEGFFLEHSPGYQSFSLRLAGIALRYITLSKIEIPPSWLRKYRAAQSVYAGLRRPDGSLPMFGDTNGGSDGAGPIVFPIDEQGRAGRSDTRAWTSDNEVLFAPIAGYTLWWDRPDVLADTRILAQTAISWSYFPGMGHKHADELSLSLWAQGTSWWQNVGYWPYDAVGRKFTESWQGSNAPHLVGESAQSLRDTRLRYHGRDANFAMIDLERYGPDAFRARRQVVHIGQRIWIVIDTSFGDKESRTRTIWTTSPTVRMVEGTTSGEYKLTDELSGRSLLAFFAGAVGMERRLVKGSQSPFGGWSVISGKVRESYAIVTERPSDGAWQLSSWVLNEDDPESAQTNEIRLSGPPAMQRWNSADDWELRFPGANGPATLKYFDGHITMLASEGRAWSLRLSSGPNVSEAKAVLRSALKAASTKYGTFDTSLRYRAKVTLFLLALLILNAAGLIIVGRIRPNFRFALGAVLIVAWLLTSYYFIYLRAQLV